MKTALITGASSGIGLALARELASRGWRVAMTARRRNLLEAEADALRARGKEVVVATMDAIDSGSVHDAVRAIMEECGTIDLAVANAGIGFPTPATRFKLEDAERIMRTNFFGMLYLFDAVIPSMIDKGSGRFAGVASLAGLRGLPATSMYSSSKAAMQAFLEASRVDLARTGVGVTVINPGFVTTPLTAKNKFKMPFLMNAERAASIIADGLERDARQIEFPLPTSLLMRFARLLPAAIYDRVVSPYGSRRYEAKR